MLFLSHNSDSNYLQMGMTFSLLLVTNLLFLSFSLSYHMASLIFWQFARNLLLYLIATVYFPDMIQPNGSQQGWPRGHLAKSRDMFWLSQLGVRGATGIQWVEARDSTKHPTKHRTTAHNKNYLLECLQCQGRETLLQIGYFKIFCLTPQKLAVAPHPGQVNHHLSHLYC